MEVQITHSQKEMSSLDLLEIINTARIEAGESEVRRNQFTERCIDELDGDHYKTFVVNNPNGTTLLRDVLATAHWLCRLSRLFQGELSRDVFQQLFFNLSSKCMDIR